MPPPPPPPPAVKLQKFLLALFFAEHDGTVHKGSQHRMERSHPRDGGGSAAERPCCLQPLLQISWGFSSGLCGQCPPYQGTDI